jgi:hypothetical protein
MGVVMAIATLVGQVVGAAAASTSRPVSTFFGVQLIAAGWIWLGYGTLPPMLAWTTSAVALALGLFGALVENVALHVEEIGEVVHESGLDRVGGALATFGTALLLSMSGAPAEITAGAIEQATPEQAELLSALQIAAASHHPWWMQAGVVLGAVATNLGLGWLRAYVVRVALDTGMKAYVDLTEDGGVLLLLVLLPVLPLLALLLVVAASIAFGTFALIARGFARRADAKARVPCPSCEESVRVEAMLCPHCHSALQPSIVLEPGWIRMRHTPYQAPPGVAVAG